MTRGKYTIITALAAALLLAGCTSTTDGEPVAVTGAGTTTAVESTTTTEPAIAKWIDVTGTVPDPPKEKRGGRFGANPYPGIGYVQQQLSLRGAPCTLGPMVRRGTSTAFVTAGHCNTNEGGRTFIYRDAALTSTVELGPLAESKDVDAVEDVDSALLVTTVAPAADATLIAGKFPIVGVMAVSGVKTLPVGTPICVDGSRSGLRCTPLISATDMIRYSHVTSEGDSGAPVFLVDQERNATLIGIHRSVEGATYLAPALTRLEATVLTAS